MNTHPFVSSARHASTPQSLSRVLAGLALLSAITLSGCATDSHAYHSFVMQGQVLSIDGSTLSVCVGEHEGASVGQVLDVVRHTRNPASPKAANPSFSRDNVGKVRIATLYDEHYATAVVLEGNPQVNDEVVLDSH